MNKKALRNICLSLSLSLAALVAGCATVRFDQTGVNLSQSAKRFIRQVGGPARQYALLIDETGEMLYADQIVTAERVTGGEAEVVLAKLDGYYFLTGPGFRQLWRVTPKAPNQACLCKMALPDTTGIEGVPRFELKSGAAGGYLLALSGRYRSGRSFALTVNNKGGLTDEK